MLTPDQIDEVAEGVADVYRQIEAELLDYLVGKMIEGDVSGQRAQTAINLMAQKMTPEIAAIIDSHREEADAAAYEEVRRSLAASDAFDMAAMGVAAGLASDALTVQTAAVASSAARALRADNLAMNEAARAKFTQWATWAVTQTATGNMTEQAALRKAVRELAGEGLAVPFVTYRDGEGRVTVRNRVDVAVQRHVRTLITQGAANLTMARMRENGVEFVEVSSHTGSRPSHAEWQGRVFHIGGAVVVDGVRYEDFEFGTGYKGTCGPYTALGDQLLGVNCRHSFAPWVPGSPRAYSPDPEHPSGVSGDEIYRLTQRQRELERRIRATKREIAAQQHVCEEYPTQENEAELARLKAKLRRQQGDIRDLIKGANEKCEPGTTILKRQPNREWAGDMPKRAARSGKMATMRHEETLVKMTKGDERNDLSISPVVNTQAYHEAFEAMPLPKPVAESAYRQTGRLLSHADGMDKEYLVAINARTGELLADNFDIEAKSDETGFTSERGRLVESCPDGAVLIHNHPGNTRPSIRDVITAAEEPSVRGSIVAAHDGSLWFVSVDDPSIADLAYSLYNQARQELGRRGGIVALDVLLKQNDKHKLFTWRRMR